MKRYILISIAVISLAAIGLPLFSSITLPEDEDMQETEEVEEIKVMPTEEASPFAPVKTKQKKTKSKRALLKEDKPNIKLILSDAVPFLSEEMLLSEEQKNKP